MRIIINEFLRVIRDKSVIFVLVVLAIFNVAILYLQEDRQSRESVCTAQQYNSIYDEIEGMTNVGACEYLESRYSTLMSDYNGESMIGMSYKVVLDEVRVCATYDEYLANIQEDAVRHSSIAIFASDDSFGSQNIVRTAETFKKLLGNELKADVSRGVNMLMGSVSTDIIAVIMLLAICAVMIIREKENGAVRLVKTCRKGRAGVALCRCASALMLCIFVELILYIPNAVIAYNMYGFGDMGRLIQSVYGFVTTDLVMTVGEYIAVFMLVKLIVLFMVAMLFILIMNLSDSAIFTYVMVVALFGVETALFYTIGDSSKLMALKNLNIYALVNTNRLFTTYRNLRLFGNPVDYRIAAAVMAGVLILASVILSAVIFAGKKSIAGTGRIRSALDKFLIKINVWDRLRTTAVVTNELYKIFIKGKTLIILAAAAAFLWLSYAPITGTCETVEDLYYLMCVNQVKGEYSDEKADYLNEQLAALESGKADVDDADVANWIAGYSGVIERAEYVKNIDGGVLMYDKGYGMLTGKDTKRELMLAMEAVIILILSVFGIWSTEYTSGMNVVMNTTVKGKKIAGVIKLVTSFVVAVVIFAGVHIPWYHNILTVFGSKYLDAPACNLQHLSMLPQWLTIRMYIIAVSVIKIFFMWGIVIGIRAIAIKIKSHIMTVITATGIFVLPLVVLRLLGGLF